MKAWEYLILTLDNTETGLRVENWTLSGGTQWVGLNAMGKDGWELCGLIQQTGQTLPSAVFKRPASEERNEYD